jgi:hypothetical protein
MKKSLLLLSLFIGNHYGRCQNVVIPSAYTTTYGGLNFNGPLSNTGITYQLLINQSELTDLVGETLTGLTFRSPVSLGTTTSWPTVATTYANYDIYLSEGVAPASRSLVFANNIVGIQLQVRSGSLVIAPNSFPAAAPTSFGSSIVFNTPYVYNGGHLLLEIRHSASDGGSRASDAIGSSNPVFGTTVSTAYTSSYAGTGMVFGVGGAAIVRFDYGQALPIKLIRLNGRAGAKGVDINWETSEGENYAYFELEKGYDGKSFKLVDKMIAKGGSTSRARYSYMDSEPNVSRCYYRLKIVDQENNVSFSNVISINGSVDQSNSMTVAPNPAEKDVTLLFNLSTTGKVTINLYDMAGRLRKKEHLEVIEGCSNHVVLLEELTPGLYLLEATGIINQTLKLEKK